MSEHFPQEFLNNLAEKLLKKPPEAFLKKLQEKIKKNRELLKKLSEIPVETWKSCDRIPNQIANFYEIP